MLPNLHPLLENINIPFVLTSGFLGLSAPSAEVPCPGIEPGPPAVETWALNHQAAGEVPTLFLSGISTWASQRHLSKTNANGSRWCLLPPTQPARFPQRGLTDVTGPRTAGSFPVLSLTAHSQSIRRIRSRDFPGGAADKNLLVAAGDSGSIPGGGGAHVPWSNRAPRPLGLRGGGREVHPLKPRDNSPRSATREAAAAARNLPPPTPASRANPIRATRPGETKTKYMNAHKCFQKENQLRNSSRDTPETSTTPCPAHRHCPGP